MSDEALRAAERAFATDPSEEHEAALLRARLRTGRLSRARVYVAAWLRHAPALAALGDEAPPDDRPAGPAVTAAFEALDDAARRALVVVALDSLEPAPPGSVADHCVAALRAWVREGRPIPPAVVEASAQQARRERRDPYDPRHRLVRIVGTGRGWGGLLLWFRLETPLVRPAARALLELPSPTEAG